MIANIKGGWDNIQSLHLKTGESVALPVWTCGLGLEAEGGRWEGLVKGEGVDAEAESGSEDEMKVDETVPKKAGGKKSKRLLDDEVLDEKPKKKVKSAQGDDASLKKKGSSSTAAEPVPAPQATPIPTEPVPVTDGPKKKKRKSKIPSPEKVLPVSVKPVPTDLEAEADIDTEPTSTIASKPKKTKRKSKSRASVEDDLPEAIAESETLVVPVVSNGISKEELKQKRSTQSGERKKDKVVKKSGKSAKDALLGRKAGRSWKRDVMFTLSSDHSMPAFVDFYCLIVSQSQASQGIGWYTTAEVIFLIKISLALSIKVMDRTNKDTKQSLPASRLQLLSLKP